MKTTIVWLLWFAVAGGYVANIIALCSDHYRDPISQTARLAGAVVLPLGAILGYV